jgi:hypothetical protein
MCAFTLKGLVFAAQQRCCSVAQVQKVVCLSAAVKGGVLKSKVPTKLAVM